MKLLQSFSILLLLTSLWTITNVSSKSVKDIQAGSLESDNSSIELVNASLKFIKYAFLFDQGLITTNEFFLIAEFSLQMKILGIMNVSFIINFTNPSTNLEDPSPGGYPDNRDLIVQSDVEREVDQYPPFYHFSFTNRDNQLIMDPANEYQYNPIFFLKSLVEFEDNEFTIVLAISAENSIIVDKIIGRYNLANAVYETKIVDPYYGRPLNLSYSPLTTLFSAALLVVALKRRRMTSS